MSQYSFGSGTLIGRRTDIANPTPVPFGVVQKVDVGFEFSLKELVGQYQAPVAVARGALKIMGKASSGRIYSYLYNQLFFGMTQATGGLLTIVNEAKTIPAPSGPYTVTVTNASDYEQDMGVFYASSGVQFTRVASSPSAGQYSVNESTGVYTFAAADASTAVLISYTYTVASGAQKITIENQLMGAAPTFMIELAETFQSKVVNLQLNQCVASKLSFPFGNQDFTINDIEFEAYADSAGIIGYLTVSE